jgi:hypothetical protein
VIFGIAALFSLVVFAPINAQEEDQAIALAPAGPSWDETSGYGSVESSRAAISAMSWDDTSGYGSVESNRAGYVPATAIEPTGVDSRRVNTAVYALLTGDLGSLQEEALAAIVAAAIAWDDTSGYGSVEASRAAYSPLAEADAVTSQVPADVRFAPDVTAADVEAFRIERQAEFRSIEHELSGALGAEQPHLQSCGFAS